VNLCWKNRIEAAKKERVRIRFTLGIGSTAEGIVSVAKSERVDFIIIGSTGLSSEGTEQNMVRVLGSVARNVSELAECPVMIVKWALKTCRFITVHIYPLIEIIPDEIQSQSCRDSLALSKPFDVTVTVSSSILINPLSCSYSLSVW